VSETPIALPPFKAVAAALRKTTEHLAREVAKPTESAPHWTNFEWAVARSVAAMQGISFLLAARLRWRGPPGWQSFLEEQREQSLLRDAVIGALLQRLDAATRDAQIGCVALKGAALRALEVYAPGERPMGDIDLLVREADLPATAAMMDRLGYRGTKVPDREIIYEPRRKSPPKGFGEHVENALKVEVHTSVAEPLPVRKVDITARLLPMRPRCGLNAYPSLTALLLHLLLRTASNMRAHTLRQIQLHDIAMLTRRLAEADWEALLGGSSAAGERWWMYPPLALTARYFACNIPPQVLRELRVACPPILRALSDSEKLTNVSWSNLRIGAFPGIAWSRTAADVLRYVRSRLLPDRKALAGIDVAIELRPQLNAIRWYGVSHGERIARWLVSRPPRVQTMLSVTAALKDGS
jgi:putative nucleotidyltransferase-like protein